MNATCLGRVGHKQLDRIMYQVSIDPSQHHVRNFGYNFFAFVGNFHVVMIQQICSLLFCFDLSVFFPDPATGFVRSAAAAAAAGIRLPAIGTGKTVLKEMMGSNF